MTGEFEGRADLEVKSSVRHALIAVCALVIISVGASIPLVAKHGRESLFVGLFVFVFVGVYFAWLITRIQFLGSIVVTADGLSQREEGVLAFSRPIRLAKWSEITRVSSRGHEIQFFRDADRFVVNLGLMHMNVDANLRRLKDLLPPHLSASI